MSMFSRCILIASLTSAIGCVDSARDLLHGADELLFTQHYLEAAKQYEEVVLETRDQQEPEAIELRATALAKLAQVRHHFLDDPAGALRTYRAVAELVPGSHRGFEARLAMVRLLRDRLGDPTTAATELLALIDAFPSDPGIPRLRLEYAQVAFGAGKYAQARTQAEKLRFDPDLKLRVEATELVATIHGLEGHHEAALEQYENLLSLALDGPTLARLRFEAARSLEELGRLEEAVSAYELAQQGAQDPSLVATRIGRVRARLSGGHRVGRERAQRSIAVNGTSIRP